jgi:hypothetical protein
MLVIHDPDPLFLDSQRNGSPPGTTATRLTASQGQQAGSPGHVSVAQITDNGSRRVPRLSREVSEPEVDYALEGSAEHRSHGS